MLLDLSFLATTMVGNNVQLHCVVPARSCGQRIQRPNAAMYSLIWAMKTAKQLRNSWRFSINNYVGNHHAHDRSAHHAPTPGRRYRPRFGPGSPRRQPVSHPQVVRALFCAVKALERVQERERNAKPQPANAGKAWDTDEDTQLLADFDWGMSIKELAHKNQRTMGTIQSRLLRVGRISAEPTT